MRARQIRRGEGLTTEYTEHTENSLSRSLVTDQVFPFWGNGSDLFSQNQLISRVLTNCRSATGMSRCPSTRLSSPPAASSPPSRAAASASPPIFSSSQVPQVFPLLPRSIPNLPRNLPRKLPRNLSLHFLLRQAYTVKHIRKCQTLLPSGGECCAMQTRRGKPAAEGSAFSAIDRDPAG